MGDVVDSCDARGIKSVFIGILCRLHAVAFAVRMSVLARLLTGTIVTAKSYILSFTVAFALRELFTYRILLGHDKLDQWRHKVSNGGKKRRHRMYFREHR